MKENVIRKQGADVNGYEDDSRIRPIHFAVQFFPPCVEYLLLAGADPYIKTQDGYNALDIAKLRGHEALFSFLERYSACKVSRLKFAMVFKVYLRF